MQDESGRLLRTWMALAASQRPLVAPGRHCCHTLLHPLVSGMDSRASLCSTGYLVCARSSSNCFCALSHFILILPYYYLHLTDKKVETQGFKLGQSDSTTTLGILPPSHLKQMPKVPPSVMSHSLGLTVQIIFVYTCCGQCPSGNIRVKGSHRTHLAWLCRFTGPERESDHPKVICVRMWVCGRADLPCLAQWEAPGHRAG